MLKYGEGELTTIYDRVNFYRDLNNDPGVCFKRDGNNISLIAGDGAIINDKLIAKTEKAFDHEFDTYVPLKKQLNKNQQIVLDWLEWLVKEQRNSPMDAVYLLVLGESLDSVSLAYIALTPDQQTQVLAAFAEWGLSNEKSN